MYLIYLTHYHIVYNLRKIHIQCICVRATVAHVYIVQTFLRNCIYSYSIDGIIIYVNNFGLIVLWKKDAKYIISLIHLFASNINDNLQVQHSNVCIIAIHKFNSKFRSFWRFLSDIRQNVDRDCICSCICVFMFAEYMYIFNRRIPSEWGTLHTYV